VSGEILLGGKEKGREEEEDSESSGGEEERDRLPDEVEAEDAAELGAGSKKKHAPRLDAFNLKGEEEEGRFDQSGNYVRKAADPDAVNDNWLEGLNKKDLKRAREAQEKREEERRRKAIEDDAFLTSDLLSTLIDHLDTSESPFEALARLNKSKPTEKKVPRWKQKKLQKDKMDTDEDVASGTGGTDAKEEARRKAVEAITGAADKLYGRGQHDIYEAERELLMRQYRRETGEDWKARAVAAAAAAPKADGGRRSGSSDMWEFRWTDGRDGGALNGPYDGPTMEAWQAAGYFGEGVEFRRVGDDHEWSRLLDTSYLG
jgi:CD2 antigen cytoplasmic tail-binding protein 2